MISDQMNSGSQQEHNKSLHAQFQSFPVIEVTSNNNAVTETCHRIVTCHTELMAAAYNPEEPNEYRSSEVHQRDHPSDASPS